MDKRKTSLDEIAKSMGRDKSTVSRELRRNKGECGYCYRQQTKTRQRHIDKPKTVKLNDGMKQAVTWR
ncbi:helix-turn-helix domain-containing protein [Methyloglobulus sp.]|uniref:helix-turn-helix domain-containing protein n=1 Tax=Methyloglobulus sp. TaxID=2518622 RepID=UPI00398A16D7